MQRVQKVLQLSTNSLTPTFSLSNNVLVVSSLVSVGMQFTLTIEHSKGIFNESFCEFSSLVPSSVNFQFPDHFKMYSENHDCVKYCCTSSINKLYFKAGKRVYNKLRYAETNRSASLLICIIIIINYLTYLCSLRCLKGCFHTLMMIKIVHSHGT